MVDFEKNPGSILLPNMHANTAKMSHSVSQIKGMLDSAKYTSMSEEKFLMYMYTQ